MISVRLEGLDEVAAAVRRLPASIDTKSAFENAAQTFSARLRADTPLGYSGKLKDSVLYELDDESTHVGYESGVETAGDPSLEGVTRVSTRGRSVVSRKKWVQVGELETVLEECLSNNSDDVVELLERGLLDGIS